MLIYTAVSSSFLLILLIFEISAIEKIDRLVALYRGAEWNSAIIDYKISLF